MLYFGDRLSQNDKLRMEAHVQELGRKREPIGIPAQVLAEFLDLASQEQQLLAFGLLKTSAFKFLPYDMKACIETVEISKQEMANRKANKEEPKQPRQAAKVDWQIIAIAKSSDARLLLTNDGGLMNAGMRAGLSCLKITDLQIPDEMRQQSISFPSDETK